MEAFPSPEALSAAGGSRGPGRSRRAQRRAAEGPSRPRSGRGAPGPLPSASEGWAEGLSARERESRIRAVARAAQGGAFEEAAGLYVDAEGGSDEEREAAWIVLREVEAFLGFPFPNDWTALQRQWPDGRGAPGDGSGGFKPGWVALAAASRAADDRVGEDAGWGS